MLPRGTSRKRGQKGANPQFFTAKIYFNGQLCSAADVETKKLRFLKKNEPRRTLTSHSLCLLKKIANAANLTFKKSQTREKKNVLARALHHCENIYLTYNGLNHVLMYGMTSLGMTMLKN